MILATYSIFSEGISEKDLCTLLLVTPKKFKVNNDSNTGKRDSGKMKQIVGRIFRKEHTDHHPMIFDFSDNFSIFRNQSRQRQIFYEIEFTKSLIKNYISVNLIFS